MFDLNKKLKEYWKFRNLKAEHVYLWYDRDQEHYIVTVMFSSEFIKKLNLKYELIK